MPWQVSFYNNKVRKETLGLPAGILANLIRIIDLIEEFGPNLGLPHTAPMGNGLFEIRAKVPLLSHANEGYQVMNQPTFSNFKKEALSNPEVLHEYQKLGPVFELKRKLLAIRQAAGMTQEQMAEALHTQKSNISRLESLNGTASPRVDTLRAYAHAAGYRLEVNFVKETLEGYSSDSSD